MERKIGEIFTYNSKIYQVVKSDTCTNCAFRENDCSIIRSRIGLVQRPNSTYDSVVNSAIKIADKLIERLKEK